MGNQLSNGISTKTEQNLDIERYMGTWYEIARYPFKYQVDCETAKATYVWDANRKLIDVENDCLVNNESIRSRKGGAWIPDMRDKGKLKINFEGTPSSGTGDYWVHWTDYNDAIVGGPSGEVLWWLSREPQVELKNIEPMLNRIKSFGYNVERLMAHPSVIKKPNKRHAEKITNLSLFEEHLPFKYADRINTIMEHIELI